MTQHAPTRASWRGHGPATSEAELGARSRGQAGAFSANCGASSPISCQLALYATWR